MSCKDPSLPKVSNNPHFRSCDHCSNQPEHCKFLILSDFLRIYQNYFHLKSNAVYNSSAKIEMLQSVPYVHHTGYSPNGFCYHKPVYKTALYIPRECIASNTWLKLLVLFLTWSLELQCKFTGTSVSYLYSLYYCQINSCMETPIFYDTIWVTWPHF